MQVAELSGLTFVLCAQSQQHCLSTDYSRMGLFMQRLDSTADNSTGLVSQDGLADWCPPANVATDPKSVSSFSQVMGWQMLSEVASALGKHDDAAAITARLARLTAAYRKAYYNSTSGRYGDSAAQISHGGFVRPNVQTSNSMALWLGVPTAEEKAKVVSALVKDVESKGHHLSTGIIGTRVLLQSLPIDTAYVTCLCVAVAGGTSSARMTGRWLLCRYAVAVQDTYPGPGNFVRNGATTM